MPSLGGASGPTMLLLMNLNDIDLSNLITIHRSTDRDEYFHYWVINLKSYFKFIFNLFYQRIIH